MAKNLEEIPDRCVQGALMVLAVSSFIRKNIREAKESRVTRAAVAMLRDDFSSPPLKDCYERFKQLPEEHYLREMFGAVSADIEAEYNLLPERTRQWPYRSLYCFLEQEFLKPDEDCLT